MDLSQHTTSWTILVTAVLTLALLGLRHLVLGREWSNEAFLSIAMNGLTVATLGWLCLGILDRVFDIGTTWLATYELAQKGDLMIVPPLVSPQQQISASAESAFMGNEPLVLIVFIYCIIIILGSMHRAAHD